MTTLTTEWTKIADIEVVIERVSIPIDWNWCG